MNVTVLTVAESTSEKLRGEKLLIVPFDKVPGLIVPLLQILWPERFAMSHVKLGFDEGCVNVLEHSTVDPAFE